jgi:hypothetical protein
MVKKLVQVVAAVAGPVEGVLQNWAVLDVLLYSTKRGEI